MPKRTYITAKVAAGKKKARKEENKSENQHNEAVANVNTENAVGRRMQSIDKNANKTKPVVTKTNAQNRRSRRSNFEEEMEITQTHFAEGNQMVSMTVAADQKNFTEADSEVSDDDVVELTAPNNNESFDYEMGENSGEQLHMSQSSDEGNSRRRSRSQGPSERCC